MSKQPQARKTFTGEHRKVVEEQRKARSTSPFFGTGMHPNGALGLDSDNYAPGVSGFSLNGGSGVAEFKDIILYDLPNSMLANPVAPAAVWQEASNFTVSPAWGNVITANITVPEGFTSASISAKGRVTAFYNNAGTGSGVDYLYAHLYVNGNSSDFYPLAVTDNGGSGTNQVFRDVVLTGLTPGGTVVLNLQASTDNAIWTAPSSNRAKLGASISWYR